MLKKELIDYGEQFVIFVVIVLMSVLVFYIMLKADPVENAHRCVTKNLNLKGVITGVTGKSGYMHVMIDNIVKPVSLVVDDEIYRKGFDQYHFYEVGDSIIKAANSKEVTVKNKDSVVVFTMACDD
jgi:hypothetical protein